MAIKMHVDDVRQECIRLLTEEPQNYDMDDIAEVYCVLTGRSTADFAVQADEEDDDNTITFYD